MPLPIYELRGMKVPEMQDNKQNEQFYQDRTAKSEILRGISKLISRNTKPIKMYEFKSTKAADIMNSATIAGPVYGNKL